MVVDDDPGVVVTAAIRSSALFELRKGDERPVTAQLRTRILGTPPDDEWIPLRDMQLDPLPLQMPSVDLAGRCSFAVARLRTPLFCQGQHSGEARKERQVEAEIAGAQIRGDCPETEDQSVAVVRCFDKSSEAVESKEHGEQHGQLQDAEFICHPGQTPASAQRRTAGIRSPLTVKASR